MHAQLATASGSGAPLFGIALVTSDSPSRWSKWCREGNIVPGKSPGPVVFVLETLSNDRFVRKGQDLLHKATVPLSHALEGSAVTVKLLNGSLATVPVDNIITPGYTVTIPDKGLPIPGSNSKFGNLVLEIGVLFPKTLSEAQKLLLRAAFYLPAELEECDAMKTFQQAFEDPVKGWQSCVATDGNSNT